MEIVKFKSGEYIARKYDKVKYWYLLQEGSVIQKFDIFDVRLEKNSIVGILEHDMFLCDYIAQEQVTLAAFSCENIEDLKKILSNQEKIRSVFLRSALEQRNALLVLYSNLYKNVQQFHDFVENGYIDYKNLCTSLRIDQSTFSKIDRFNPFVAEYEVREWEVHNSNSIVNSYMKEYLSLMQQDDDLTVGVIMETATQMRRVSKGIGEIESYFIYNKDILMSEWDYDLFQLYFDLAKKIAEKGYSIETVSDMITKLSDFSAALGVYNSRMIERRQNEYHEYDFTGTKAFENEGIGVSKEINILTENCLVHILEYAGYNDSEIDVIEQQIHTYHNLPDLFATDKETQMLRKTVAALFYDIYYKVFMKAVTDEGSLNSILRMFLNFGFMDVSYIGEEHAKVLCELSSHLAVCSSNHVYTIYEWLKAVYRGDKMPSKDEFDMDYSVHLAELYRTGKISQEQMKEDYEDCEKRVRYEIENMFRIVNKATYGKITTFCPILWEYDLINSLERMLVTADKLEKAMNQIRKVDYSIFYREVVFSDPEKGINNERVMKEVLPDIILMPNAGTKAMMWQETSGIKTNTPGRFMFPILTAMDVDDLMLETMARFRWELCRRIEGMRWNDIREQSLTAEYNAYIQFYRKNHDLSPEAKQKLKNALVRAKNNYREVFVKDYIHWIKYESRGSFRLNKVARDILVRYCPFGKQTRNDLKLNPVYQSSVTRFETELAKKYQKYSILYAKYEKAEGQYLHELKENLTFYEL